MTERKRENSRERAAGSYNSIQRIARKEVKKPLVSSGSFGYFSSRCVKKICLWHILASDLGGYAAVASAVFTQRDWEK